MLHSWGPAHAAGDQTILVDGQVLFGGHPPRRRRSGTGRVRASPLSRSVRFAAESDRNHKLMFADNTPGSLQKLLTGQELAE